MAELAHARLLASRRPRTAAHETASVAAAAGETFVDMKGRSVVGAGTLKASVVDASSLRISGGMNAGNTNVEGVATLHAARVRCSGDARVRSLEVEGGGDVVVGGAVRCAGEVAAASLRVGKDGAVVDGGAINLCGGALENVGTISLSAEIRGTNTSSLRLGGKAAVDGATGNASFAGEVSAGSVAASGNAHVAQKLSVGGGLNVTGGAVVFRGSGAVDMSSRSLVVGQGVKCESLDVAGKAVSMKSARLEVDALATSGDVVSGGSVKALAGEVEALSVVATSASISDALKTRTIRCSALAEFEGQLVLTGGASGIVLNAATPNEAERSDAE